MKTFLRLIPDKDPGLGPKALGRGRQKLLREDMRQRPLEVLPRKPVDINMRWLALVRKLTLGLMLNKLPVGNLMQTALVVNHFERERDEARRENEVSPSAGESSED